MSVEIAAMTETGGRVGGLGATLADGRLFTGDPAEVGRAALENGSGLRAEDALIIVGGLVTLVSLVSLIGWLRQQKLRPTAGLLFLQTARSLGLTLRDCWLLQRIARGSGHDSGLALLLCPGTLGRCARWHARQLPRGRGFADLARAASVRRHVFGPGDGAEGHAGQS